MKKSICLAASLLALNLTPGFGQQPQGVFVNFQSQNSYAATNLSKFNLDFPGGTPKALVAAIEKAMGKPVNVIVPDEDAATKLPAFRLNEVTFPQLSETLQQGSSKQVYSKYMDGRTFAVQVGYNFRTSDNPPSDNSIWFFSAQNPPPELVQPPVQKVCQFYSLSPYLDHGFTVDDITTAIQTGWKMAGETSTPELSYHKETKMLIAFGELNKLDTIQKVLGTLPSSKLTRNEVEALKRQVKDLETQVNALSHSIPDPHLLRSSVEEKSGK